MVAKMPENS